MKGVAIRKFVCALAIVLGVQSYAQTPPDISLTFYLEERSENGTQVGTVTATDPDGDPLTYSILSGNTLGAFAINATSGDLSVADETHLNFDVNPSFVLEVEANDGNGGLTSVEITINLIDIPLGLEDAVRLTIYPNPVADVLFMDVGETSVNELEVALYSLTGTLIPVTPLLTSDARMEVNFRSIKKGVYVLRIGDENQTISRRIIVK